MTPKRKRLVIVASVVAAAGIAATLVLNALQDSIVFFFSPSDLAARDVAAGQTIRLGGLVAEGSVEKTGASVRFVVTDTAAQVPVVYSGLLPNLFREGQGVVTEGHLDGRGVFVANEVLAKHDERYMPREVADALKKSGHWQPQ